MRTKTVKSVISGEGAANSEVTVIANDVQKGYIADEIGEVKPSRHHYGEKIEFWFEDFEEIKEIDLYFTELRK